MKTSHTLALGCLSLVTLLPAASRSAAADVTRPENRPTAIENRRELKQADRHFLDKAIEAGTETVEISRAAFDRTGNPRVREFAQKILAEHLSANDELALIAANRGVSIPAKGQESNTWAKKDAKNFDKDYIDKMVSSHEDAVKLYQKEATDGDDAEAVAFARKILPKLQQHLEQAADLKRLMN